LRAKKKVIEIREKFKSTFKTGQGTKQFN